MVDTQPTSVTYYHREKQRLEQELVYKEWFKNLFYGTFWGRLMVHMVFKRRWFSSLYARSKKTAKSVEQIPQFIDAYQIDTDEILRPLHSFRSLNDFFIRRLQPSHRPFDKDPKALVAPCDSRLFVSPLNGATMVPIKGMDVSIDQLVPDRPLMEPFTNGSCLVFRLVPADCHRFFHIDDGIQSPVTTIDGWLHATSPADMIMPNFQILLNFRQYCRLATKNFGEMIQIEIGAMTVGTIRQHDPGGATVKRGDEKGYFEFGGSTVVLLFKPGTILIDEDIAEQSTAGVETLVKYGTAIGRAQK